MYSNMWEKGKDDNKENKVGKNAERYICMHK